MGTSGCHTECLYGSSFPPKHNTCKSSLNFLNLWIRQNNPVEMTEFLLQACWVLHCFAQVKIRNDANLVKALELTHNALCTDKELPVRVEAAIALQMLLAEQDRAKDILKPHVSTIIIGMFEKTCSSNSFQKIFIFCAYCLSISRMCVNS